MIHVTHIIQYIIVYWPCPDIPLFQITEKVELPPRQEKETGEDPAVRANLPPGGVPEALANVREPGVRASEIRLVLLGGALGVL